MGSVLRPVDDLFALMAWAVLYIFGSNIAGDQSISPSLSQIWGYSGLIMALALIGAVLTLQSDNRSHAALLGGLSFAFS